MGEGAELGLAQGPSGPAVGCLFQLIGPLCPRRSLGSSVNKGQSLKCLKQVSFRFEL